MPELRPALCTTNACGQDPKPATHRLVIRGERLIAVPASALGGANLCDDCANHWIAKEVKSRA